METALPVAKFVDIYQQLDKSNLHLLNDIYSEQIKFKDPMHEIHGISELTRYFSNLYSNVKHCQFDISDTYECDDKAFLYWTMHYAHPKLASGKTISVEGHSKLVFKEGKIINHRDYFNVGEMLYKHIPILGGVINYIDKRAG